MLKDKARALRQNMTDAEQHLWRCLRRKQVNGHRFCRQLPLGRYVADFVCYDARLVIEIDGAQHMDHAARDLETGIGGWAKQSRPEGRAKIFGPPIREKAVLAACKELAITYGASAVKLFASLNRFRRLHG